MADNNTATNNTERVYTQAEVDEILKAASEAANQQNTSTEEPSRKEKLEKIFWTGGKVVLGVGVAVAGFFVIKDMVIPFFNKDKNPEAIEGGNTYVDEYGNNVEVTQL